MYCSVNFSRSQAVAPVDCTSHRKSSDLGAGVHEGGMSEAVPLSTEGFPGPQRSFDIRTRNRCCAWCGVYHSESDVVVGACSGVVVVCWLFSEILLYLA